MGMGPDEPVADATERMAPHPPRREFYKSMGLETTEDMKLRLYSIAEYQNEFGGADIAGGGFVAAIKAYRQLDDEWYDYSPRKAAEVFRVVNLC